MKRIQSWSTTLCALLALVLSAPVQAQAISSAAMESKLQNLYDTWKDRDGGWILLPDPGQPQSRAVRLRSVFP